MFETPLKPDGHPDRNSLVALIKNLEESIAALNRRKESIIIEGQIGPINTQISLLEGKLRDTRLELESIVDKN